MKLIKLEQNTEQWHKWRERKVTGTKSDMAPLRGKLPKQAFFKYISERVCVFDEDIEETAIQRGNRLEPVAKQLLADKLNKTLNSDFVVEGEFNTGLSPDALITSENNPKAEDITEAVEIKCPLPHNYLEAMYKNVQYKGGNMLNPRSSIMVNKGVPVEYLTQALSYFLLLPNLKTLYFCMYCPEIVNKDHELLIIEIGRDEIADELSKHKDRLYEMLNEAQQFVEYLEGF